jgi:hypothetical protein
MIFENKKALVTGSPGMNIAGFENDPFDVMAFTKSVEIAE